MESSSHYSVLLQESVSALIGDNNTAASGIFVDGTFGRGGHSRAILERIDVNGKLIAFDKDPQAIVKGKELEKADARFGIRHSSFAQMQKILHEEGISTVNGILLDLGVSSPQLDEAERGFSFLHDGPLDMRMDNSKGISAADWVNTTKEEEIAKIFKEFGEERFARRMAAAIVKRRTQQAFTRTGDLAKVISEANPAWEKGKHPATRAFQAIRIAINSELQDLQNALVQAVDLLKPGGRLVVISFHSLEDRIVKRFFRDKSKGKIFPAGLPVTEAMLDKQLKLIGKAVKAGEQELTENVRSRSAVMRIAEKIA